MKLPGFTAEVSLHKMSNMYHIFKIQHQAYGIHPAYFGESGYPELDPNADLGDYTEPGSSSGFGQKCCEWDEKGRCTLIVRGRQVCP